MSEKSIKEKVSLYVTLKIVQTVICLVLFAIGGAVIALYAVAEAVPDDFYIGTHIFTWVCLLSGVLAGIASVLLHNGNKNGDMKTLKTFLYFGCMTYSMFDMCAGGFPLVRERMKEIEAGGAPLARIDKV